MESQAASDFTISDEQRSMLVPHIDVEALQRFLRHALPTDEERVIMLHGIFFQKRNSAVHLIDVAGGDPVVSGMLAEIYAPVWMEMGIDAIEASDEASDSRLPGRQLARVRLTRP